MRSKQLILFLLFICAPLYSAPNETVVLIHGFLGASWNLQYYEHALKQAHLHPVAWDYPSREKTIHMHAQDLVHYLQREAQQHPERPIHFLTHSMGGLVLRAAINHPDCPVEAKLGRAVLLVPPNKGSIWGRKLGEWEVVRALCQNQSGRELLTQHHFDYLGVFPPGMQIKVIAGKQSPNPFLSVPNDGIVTVDETFLTTPHEHTIVDEEHHLILISQQASQLAVEFLLRP